MNKPIAARSGRLRRSLVIASFLGLAALRSSADARDLYASWLNEYDPNGTTSQSAKAVDADKQGNVFVLANSKDAALHDRFYTAKYDALDGHLIWEMFESSPNGDFSPVSLAVDSAGDVVVTGTRNLGNYDYYTVKYSGVNGARVWSGSGGRSYDGTAGGQDDPVKVITDSANNVIVTGRSVQNVPNASGFDFITIKYNGANGNQIGSVDRYTTASSRDDIPADLAVDSLNNVIIVGRAATGSGINQLYVRKVNGAMTAEVWHFGPIDTGGYEGATGVAIDSDDNVLVVGRANDVVGHPGIFTIKLDSGGTEQWRDNDKPFSLNYTASLPDIAVGPDKCPVVTGSLCDNNDVSRIHVIKFAEFGTNKNANRVFDITDDGADVEDSISHRVVVDGSSNAIILGETDVPEGTSGEKRLDIYLAKFEKTTGARLYSATFGGNHGTDDTGVDLALDSNGGVTLVGTAYRDYLTTSLGLTELATIKFNHFIASTGDDLPDDPNVPVNAKYASGNAPALSDTGAVASSVKILSGKTKLGAIFTQGAAGGTTIPAVQGGPAPVPGVANAKWASFSDPILSPDGHYAFAAKLSGVTAAQASGVWTNLGGTLHLALQKGVAPSNVAEKLTSVMSLSLRNSQLLALIKVAAPANANTVLLGLNAANTGTVLLRTNAPITLDNPDTAAMEPPTTVKTITVLSPAVSSPGDGRWQGDANTVIKVTLADKRTVLYRVTPAGTLTPMLYTNGNASGVTSMATWKTFGPPAVSSNGQRFAVLGTLNPKAGIVSATNDTALMFSSDGTNFQVIAKEDSAPNDATVSSLKYAGFSDPLVSIVGASNKVAFLGLLKGTGVNATNNRALFFGTFGGTYAKKARLGDFATDSAGFATTAKWKKFTSFALSGGTNGAPIFVATLSGAGVSAKNNAGLWAVDASGDVRRLLRTGDYLGNQKIASFTLLKAVPTAFTAARSFNNADSVAALVSFTDKTQALVAIGIP